MIIMKKFFVILLFFSLFLSGCGRDKEQNTTESPNLKYENRDLGFSLDLPSEFEYFQTQRKVVGEYTDLEIFVPTSDRGYAQEIQSYAKPVVIRIMDKNEWDENVKSLEENLYQNIGGKKDIVYTIRFWTEIPSDWISKWNDGMKQNIIENFKIIK